jgi:hypothetical protein
MLGRPSAPRIASLAYASCRTDDILSGRGHGSGPGGHNSEYRASSAEAAIMQRDTMGEPIGTMVVGVFDDSADAAEALRALRSAGFKPEQISTAMLQAPEVPEAPDAEVDAGEPRQLHVDETTGILAGGVLGGLAGWLIGATAVAVPGLGALIAAGALVGALGGAGIGAAAGGLIGYLVDQGLSHDEAQYYHERVRHGAALVIVHADDRAAEAHAIIHRQGGHDYHTRPAR